MTTTTPSDHIDRILAALEKRGQQTLARLASLPKSKRCPDCAHVAHLDASSLYADLGAPQEPAYICPACSERERKDRFVRRLDRAGIPADVRSATLENFRIDRPSAATGSGYSSPAQFLAAARRFAVGEIRNLVLAGGVGIGKGHLAAALCIRAMRGGKRTAWAECARLFRDFHRAYETRTTEQVIAPLIRADILVLDEICLRKLPDDGEEILFAILDPRHKAKRQTILLAISQLRRRAHGSASASATACAPAGWNFASARGSRCAA
jgi:DNA replication protein DnaC